MATPEPSMFGIGQITLFGILGFLVSFFLNHVLSNRRDKKNRRLEEGKKVIEAFTPELDALNQTQEDARKIMTESAYRRHESAVRNFKPYLSWINRWLMQKAWKELAHHKEDKNLVFPLYEQYDDNGSLDKRRKVRPLLLKRIEGILSFTRK